MSLRPKGWISPKAWIWISVLIAAASNSVVVKIQQLGASHPTPCGVNPISYCNLLFSGSIVAFVTLTLLRPRNLMPSVLKSYPPRIWILALLSAGLAGGIAPILLFEALAKTSVTSVVLMQTVEIPLVLAFAWVFLRENPGGKALIGGALALAGVVLTSWSGNGVHLSLGTGELMAVTGTAAAVLATQLGRGVMERMSPILFGTIRNLFGMLLFAAIVLWFFGPGHFTDVLSPYLWAWTLLYGSVIVVLGQLTWLCGLSSVKAADIALAAAFTPVAGVFFAWVILGEHPTKLQLTGGAVIMAGVFLHLAGNRFPGAAALSAEENASGSIFRGI